MPKKHRIVTLFLISLLISCTQSAPEKPAVADAATTEAAPEGVLPKTAIPKHYTLELTIIPQEEDFSGKVGIGIDLRDAANHIWLHGKKIKISKSTATLANGSTIEVGYRQITESGVARIDFGQKLAPQELTLNFEYTAQFDTDLEGLYRTKSENEWYAFTQFEAIAARLAFPGFDEPAFKTPFDITLVVDENHAASAPYSLISETNLGNGRKRIQYKTTEALPTYLIAFAIGPMDVVTYESIPPNDVRKRPIPLRGFAAKGKGKLLDYALKHTGTQLALLESYFGIPYPYDKIDIIAVPDFSAGAMENVGVITFRDWLLLVDEKTAPARQKRAYAYVMAHELAHQWFGNLVTMPWWDDLWLNEAFASWMESIVIRDFAPSYKAELSTVQTSLYAMGSDSKVSARQIRQPITNEHDIHNAFDGITYSKGEGVLGMFENYLGEDDFRKGIQHHMRKFSHGNATTDDFLVSLSESTGKDITSSFKSFLLQPGVPFLNIQVQCKKSGAATVKIEQSRYFPVGSTGDSNKTWEIPYCARYQVLDQSHQECHLLKSVPQQEVTLKHEGCPIWYLPNADGAGYYRWNLDDIYWKNLQGSLPALASTEILSLTDSLKAAGLSGKLNATTLLEAAPLFVNLNDRQVATAPMGTLSFVRDHLLEDGLLSNLETFSQKLYKKRFKKLGFGTEKNAPNSDEDKLLRKSLLGFLAFTAKAPAVRKKLHTWGNAYLGIGKKNELAPQAVDPNLASVALRTAIQDGEVSTLETAIAHLKKASNPMVRSQLLAGIGAANTPQKSQLVRDLLLGEALRSSERGRLLGRHMSVRENTLSVWTWVQEHYAAIAKAIPTSHIGYFPFVASGFCTEEKRVEVQNFFADKVKDFPGGPRNLQSVTESIQLCAARKKAMQQAINDFFMKTVTAKR